MLPRNHPDRIQIAFDDHRLVANAGLLLPATLAQHLGLGELVDHHLNLGSAPGGRPAPWAARSRRHPPWAPSCAASGGATSVNSTGCAASCWHAHGRPGARHFGRAVPG